MKPFISIDEDAVEKLKYSVGALIYTPAVHTRIAERLCSNMYASLSSIAFCFEDALLEGVFDEAKEIFLSSLRRIAEFARAASDAVQDSAGKKTKIFIRARTPEQIAVLAELIRPYGDVVTGFVLPKYDADNAGRYEEQLLRANERRASDGFAPLFVMPILETTLVMYKETRLSALLDIKRALDAIAPYILNVRVGGNDFCGIFGLRRGIAQTIYDIALVKDALSDILNIFSRDYVVSGPVWEYFETSPDDTRWRTGLERELELDRLNGFIGKTAIHPSQLPVIAAGMRVSAADFADAAHIAEWDDRVLGVSKSPVGGRMNEVAVHAKWARKILLLADIYGVVED